MQLHRARPSDVHNQTHCTNLVRRLPWREQPARPIGVTLTTVVGGSKIKPRETTNAFSGCTTPCASTANRTRVTFHREGLLVGTVPCLRSTCRSLPSLYSINVTWSRDSDPAVSYRRESIGWLYAFACNPCSNLEQAAII